MLTHNITGSVAGFGGLGWPFDILPFNFCCSVYHLVLFWNERRVSKLPWCLRIAEGQKEDCLLVQELRLKTLNVLIGFLTFVLKVR